MKKTAKQFVQELRKDFQTLFDISEKQCRMYFSQPDLTKEKMADFFKVRMFNERWNMVEIAKKVSELPVNTPAEEARLLAKQAYDEAEHFRLVCEVLEHITGQPVDLDAFNETHGELRPGYGAMLIKKYEAQQDPLVLAVYQFLVEGQGSHVWATMADCAYDDFIKKRYARIARDEKFHMGIGRHMLEKLCETEEAQARALEVARQIYWDLYECHSIALFPPTEEIQQMMRDAYGEPPRKLCVPI